MKCLLCAHGKGSRPSIISKIKRVDPERKGFRVPERGGGEVAKGRLQEL